MTRKAVTINTRSRSNPMLRSLPNKLKFYDPKTGRRWSLKRKNNSYRSKGVTLRINPAKEIIADSIYHNGRTSGFGIRKNNNLPASAIVSVLKSGIAPTAYVKNSSWKIFGSKRIPRIYLNNSNNLYPGFTPSHSYIPIRKIARSFVSNKKLSKSNIETILSETYDDFPDFPKFTQNKVNLMHNYSGLDLDTNAYFNALNKTGLIKVAPLLQLTRQYPPLKLQPNTLSPAIQSMHRHGP